MSYTKCYAHVLLSSFFILSLCFFLVTMLWEGGGGNRGPEPKRIGGGRQEIKVPEAGEQGTGCGSF